MDIKTPKSPENTQESKWSLMSWQNKDIRHQPPYDDKDELRKVLAKVEKVPSIVEVDRIHALKNKLKECAEGKRMIVQLGDCSETFKDCNEESIANRLVLYTLSQLLVEKMLNKKVTKIGRIAGQYAKPRSSPTEIIDGEVINSYFGDNVNKFEACKVGRVPDPKRLLQGYHWAVTTYHSLRQTEEEANLHETLSHVLEERLRDIEVETKESDDFVNFINTLKDCIDQDKVVEDTFTSHEGLILDYESRLTRLLEPADKYKKTTSDGVSEINEYYYNTSAHFLWVGERTNRYNEAHIEYFRGIENPIGMKCGSRSTPEDIVRSIKLVNPDNEMGKVCLIIRFGVKNIEEKLPELIKEVTKNDLNVVWICDPVHGNTYTNDFKCKVRSVKTVLEELTTAYSILSEHKQVFSGVHIEASAENVTECVEGIDNLTDGDLHKNYTTHCDPRLNFMQTLHVLYKLCEVINDYNN